MQLQLEIKQSSLKEKEKIDEVVTLSILYDFYGALLDDHKRQIFSDYILNDYSLGEIADETGLSRQGVHDIVKRCSKKLKEYEEKLQLAAKFYDAKQKLNQIKQTSEEIRKTREVDRIMLIEQLSEEILNEL